MSVPAFTTVAVEVDEIGTRGTLYLNRPEKLNPLGPTTLQEIADAARWFDDQHGVKVVVVAGHGRAFTAGADLGAFADGDGSAGIIDAREGTDLGRQMADAVEAMRAVTVAKIHGHCVGGGVVLAAACDLRVCASSTRFAVPEVALGIPLTWGGVPRLVREIGPSATKDLVLTCRPFDGDEALRLGLVNRSVPEYELNHVVDELVTVLLSRSAFTLEATKRRVNAISESMVNTAGAWADADSLVVARRDPESRAAAQAYLESLKRG